MKLLLILGTCMAAATTAGAQELPPEVKKNLEAYRQKRWGTELPQLELKTLVPQVSIGEIGRLKPGIYALPQDNMPCMVPETADIAQMPNAFPDKKVVGFGQIPNVAPKLGPPVKRNNGEPGR